MKVTVELTVEVDPAEYMANHLAKQRDHIRAGLVNLIKSQTYDIPGVQRVDVLNF